MTHPKIARADHDILDVIRDRWSPRAFDPDRSVTHDELRQIFEAARWAPSSRNEQPWRFLIADRRSSAATFDAIVETLLGRNPDWAPAAPVLVLVAVRTTHTADDTPNRVADYDTGQAVAFLTLQATAMGLAVRQMAGFNGTRAREVLGVPEPYEPAVVIALGYPGDPEGLTVAAHRDAERRPRARKPLGDFVFDGAWGRAFD